jgi:selenocysteine lyase/cysteine desulfurase
LELIPLELPTTVERLLEMASNVRLGDTNREGALVVDPRLIVLEHVTRVTAQVLPVTELILAMSGKHTHSLVDGNDALGMLPNLCLPEVGCSFYV